MILQMTKVNIRKTVLCSNELKKVYRNIKKFLMKNKKQNTLTKIPGGEKLFLGLNITTDVQIKTRTKI